jgi:hypothetical protein
LYGLRRPNTGSLGRAQPKRGQRRERNQQHVAPTSHAAHMQRGSYTTVEHRARVRHAAAGALVAHHAVCRAAHSSAHGAISEHATPVLYGSPPPIPSPRVPVMGASWPPVPAQSSSGPPVPVLGTQQVLLPPPLLQQLVLVRGGRLFLHARRA